MHAYPTSSSLQTPYKTFKTNNKVIYERLVRGLMTRFTSNHQVCILRNSTQQSPAATKFTPLHHRSRLQVCAAVKKITEKNVACSKTLVALPGKEADVQALCSDLVKFSKQRQRDTSLGIISFDCSSDIAESNIFHFWEVYESNVALGRHNTAPEVELFMKNVQPLLTGPIGMALYEMKGGNLGAVCVQGGPRGEGGLDDATGASGAAGGASYKQTSGAVDLTNIAEEENDKDDRGLWGIKFELPWMKKNNNK